MHVATRSSSTAWSQALKKSACMVDAAPEESVTCPGLVGMRNLKVATSIGTGVGCVSGHRL